MDQDQGDRRRAGLALSACACASLFLAGCEQKASSAAGAPAQVGERLVVRQESIPDLKPMAATIVSRDTADARARIAGTLVELKVKAGDVVHRGEVIGRVSDPRIGLQTRAYDAQAQAAEAQSASAAAQLARTRDLFDHGVYAKARLDADEAASRSAAGAQRAAEAQRAASAELAAQGAVLAPADGRVLTADVPAGSVVEPGQSIAQITAGPTVLRIEAPESDAAGLIVGRTVEAEIGPTGVRAAIVRVYPAVTGGKVVADLDAPGLAGDLVGRRVAVSLALGERKALVIPTRYVITRSGVDFVRAVGAGGTVDEVPVQLAPGPAPGLAEVLSGVLPGDVLVPPGASR